MLRSHPCSVQWYHHRYHCPRLGRSNRKRGLDAAWTRRTWADFSHDSADAGRLLARVAADADVAIGSRYVAGGSVHESWGFRRRQLSLWGNRMARWIAGLKGVRDCTV